MDSRVTAKFGKNRPLRNWRKVVSYCLQKNRLRGTRSSPHFGRTQLMATKISWTLSPLISACVPNLVWIGWSLLELLAKDWSFGPPKWPKSIGWKRVLLSDYTYEIKLHSELTCSSCAQVLQEAILTNFLNTLIVVLQSHHFLVTEL